MNKLELTELYDLLCKFESEYADTFGSIALCEINHTINHVSKIEGITKQ